MIYCCYPGTGKTYAARLREDTIEYRYDYPKRELWGDSLTEEQQKELDEYLDERGKEIEELSKEHHHVFMQPDFRLFKAMDRKNLTYTIIIPDYRIKGMKDVMLLRYIRRGTTMPNFLEDTMIRWDSHMEGFEKKAAKKIYLKENQYVLDVIE